MNPLRNGLGQAWQFVRSAPLTYLWLLILLYTTILGHEMSPARLNHILIRRSTNLHHLDADPVHVLVSSLFWIDGGGWLPVLFYFTVFLAPAERWLGTLRWAAVGLTAHVGATYLSEGWLYLAMERHEVAESMVNVRDIGVSYFLAGVAAVLAYHVARPWRWLYLAAVLLLFGTALVRSPGMTPIGHMCAVAIGLCCYPLTVGRGPQWHPEMLRSARRGATRRLRTRGADRSGSGAAAPLRRVGR